MMTTNPSASRFMLYLLELYFKSNCDEMREIQKLSFYIEHFKIKAKAHHTSEGVSDENIENAPKRKFNYRLGFSRERITPFIQRMWKEASRWTFLC
jgi:hypothetical protein